MNWGSEILWTTSEYIRKNINIYIYISCIPLIFIHKRCIQYFNMGYIYLASLWFLFISGVFNILIYIYMYILKYWIHILPVNVGFIPYENFVKVIRNELGIIVKRCFLQCAVRTIQTLFSICCCYYYYYFLYYHYNYGYDCHHHHCRRHYYYY